ncbi:endonuclease/exonuclease/phosphatase family protein [Sunxiuqinia sp. sy24]|uniref:endonuclease/exonuclease/phosphatase family protein n=1 Tax=Sunxiuqinia sp. sy24 TaxID=3461495 RepID=UPI0040468871
MKLSYLILLVLFTFCKFIAPAQTNLKLMTFNVRYDESIFNKGTPKKNDWANRKDFQVGLINFHLPDVVGMQEPHRHQIDYFDQQLPTYKWIGVAREDGKDEGEFNPIFYRADKFRVLSSGTLWLSKTPEKVSLSWDAGYTRICTWALFENVNSTGQFYVFNTHFDSVGKEARFKSARLLNDTLKIMTANKPVFVMGDFNLAPDSPAYDELTSNGLFDSKMVSEKEPYGPEGTFNGFRFGTIPQHRIDYIFVNKQVNVKHYGVLTDSKEKIYASDHFPVVIHANIIY